MAAATPAIVLPFWRQRWVWRVALMLLFLLSVAWLGRNSWEIERTQREFSQRIADSAQRSRLAEQKVVESSVALGEVQKKIVLLEARLAESQAQQAALEQLYTELSRHRDEAQAAEVEQWVSLAAQQLQLAGNVSGALILLQNADTRLARIDRPQFLGVRRALARDIERLKALPSTDLSGLVVKLDQLVQAAEVMPLLVDAKPALRSAIIKPATAPASASQATASNAWSRFWSDLGRTLWDESRQLIQVRRLDQPEAMLLTPSQAYFVRENLKLRLLNARLQVLSRNEAAFRQDVLSARQTVAKYFDLQQKSVQTSLQTLDQLQQAEVMVTLPTLSESLNAVRYFKPEMPAPRPATKER